MDGIRLVVPNTIGDISERWKRRVDAYRDTLSVVYDRDEIDQVDATIAVLSTLTASRGEAATIRRGELCRLAYLAQCDLATSPPGDVPTQDTTAMLAWLREHLVRT